MVFSGLSPDDRLVEFIELPDHPWFVATQAHPELKSRPTRPHPLFDGFVRGGAPARPRGRGTAAGGARRADGGGAASRPCARGRDRGRHGSRVSDPQEQADRRDAWFETLDRGRGLRGLLHGRPRDVRPRTAARCEREIVRHDDAVAVVPVLDDGRVVLLRQYRQPLRRYVLEIPAGKMDVTGESPEQVAHRELAEEIGHDARELVHLVIVRTTPRGGPPRPPTCTSAAGSTRCRLPDGFEPEAEEADMEVVTFDAEDASPWPAAGDLIDAKTLVGLLLAAPHLRAT